MRFYIENYRVLFLFYIGQSVCFLKWGIYSQQIVSLWLMLTIGSFWFAHYYLQLWVTKTDL